MELVKNVKVEDSENVQVLEFVRLNSSKYPKLKERKYKIIIKFYSKLRVKKSRTRSRWIKFF